MTPPAAESLAAALAALIAVTGIAARPDPEPPAHVEAEGRMEMRSPAAVGMPNTGPADIPVKPLTVIVTFGASHPDGQLRGELAEFGAWLSEHHGRARLGVVDASGGSELVDPASIDTAGRRRKGEAAALLPAGLAGRRGQRLVVAVGQARRPRRTSAASLWLRDHRGAEPMSAVELHDGDDVELPVDFRRRGAVAATAARAVISLARLREVPR